ATIALGREEHLVVRAFNHLQEVGIEGYDRTTAHELGGAEVFEPQLRTLHAIERAMGAVGERHHCRLCSSHLEIADELASNGTRGGNEPYHADVVGKSDDTYGRI